MPTTPHLQVLPLAEAHFQELWGVADAVARERRWLAMTQAPPLDAALAFYRDMARAAVCHVALLQGRVVGWCDVLGVFGDARAHAGTLGIGLLAAARGQGIGAQLMQAAIGAAWRRGLTRIELTVREDDHVARRLYERLGFVHEGRKPRSMRIDGHYVAADAMALLKPDDAAG